MGISPMWVGETLPLWGITCLDDQRNPINLTDAVLSVLICDTVNGSITPGQGAFTVSDAVNGVAHYAWDITDTATAGQYTLQLIATYGAGPLYFSPIPWEVKPQGEPE